MMRRISVLYLVLILLVSAAVSARASDATTAQLVMAANATATEGGAQASIASLFTTKFATSLPQGQTVTLSVTHAATFATEGFASNTFLSLFMGKGLVPLPAGSFLVWDKFFQPGEACPEPAVPCLAPTELGGVRVRLNDKPAFISAVVSGAEFDQINLISPDDEAIGDGIKVEVESEGQSGETIISLQDRAPAFFPWDVGERRFLRGLQNDFSAFVGPADLFGGAQLPGGLEIRPVKPGDLVQLFGTGFGPTEPPLPAGQIPVFPPLFNLVDQVDVRVGGQTARVLFAGAAPGLAGVVQIVIEIPEVADGDQSVVAEIAGRPTQANALIPVQRMN